MTDPLSLLRQYNIEKKKIIEKNDQIIFGEYSFSKYVPTNFIESRGKFGGPRKYYTLEALLFCLKHKSSRKEYATQARDKKVPYVSRRHRHVLLAYLNGDRITFPGFDHNVPWRIPKLDAKLPTSAKPPSPLKDQFSCKEYLRFKSAPMNFFEFDAANASQQKKTTIPEPAKFVESEDGCQKLLDGPYSFTKDKEMKNRTYWRCEFQALSRCPARITTVNDQIESKWRSHDHGQSKPPPDVEVTEIKYEIKMNSVDASDTETSSKNIENVDSLHRMIIETINASIQDLNCRIVIKSEMTRKDTENVNSLAGTNIETIKANAQDVNCLSATSSEITKEDNETNSDSTDNSGDTSSERGSQDAQDDDALALSVGNLFDKMELKIVDGLEDFLEEELSLVSLIYSLFHRLTILRMFNDVLDSVMTDLQVAYAEANSFEMLQSSVKKVNFSTKSSESNLIKVATPSEQLHGTAEMRSIESETTKADTEMNSDSVDKSNDTSSESGSQDADTLMLSVLDLFDEMASKVVDGAKDFLEEELSLISLIYSVFHRLIILRKFNDALDSVMTDLEVANAEDNASEKLRSVAKRVDFSTKSSESDSIEVATPSKQLLSTVEIKSVSSEASESEVADVSKATKDAETNDSASESSKSDDDDIGNVNLSKKITCVCVICDKPIDIPPDRDMRFVMEAHLYSLHPSYLDPLDSASDSDEDESSESDEESEPPNDPTILLDGTKLEDFEVKFDRENALKYITHSNGIFLNQKNAYICYVCGSYMPLQKHLGHHLRSRAHREKSREYRRHSIEAKKNHVVAVNPDIFVIRRGNLYCLKCQAYFLNPHAFLSHVSEQHEQKLKLDFPIVSVGGTEFCSLCDHKIKAGRQALVHVASKEHYLEFLKVTTVVQLRSIKFCSLCNVKLFTESQFNSHVNDDSHISKLELIEIIVSGLKFGKKSKLFHV